MATAQIMHRQLIILGVLAFCLGDLQCVSSLADGSALQAAGETGTRGLLPVEYRQGGRKSKSGAAAAAAESFESNLDAAAASSLKRRIRRRLTNFASYDDVDTGTNRLEVEALTVFKAAITSDLLGTLKTWRANDSNACSWAGVVCTSQHPRHVIGLNLRDRQLVGNFNLALQEVGNLPFLQRLDLSLNKFTGYIPASLANCSNLSYFNMSYNELSGDIPSQLGELVRLEIVALKRNNLTGEIPPSLGNCTLIRILDLKSNFMEGEIPATLGRLSRLDSLDLGTDGIGFTDSYVPIGTNSFSGSIAVLGNCSSLAYLRLRYNAHLGGDLPPELSRLKRLEVLDISGCGFEGSLPAWLGNLTSLTGLLMNLNRFSGEIPDSLGQLRNLTDVALAANNLTGVIPTSITNSTRLFLLNLVVNQLSGNIPPQIGLLRNLKTLLLSENTFTGIIPSSMANCSGLTELSLGWNLFDPQTIPSWMGSFPNLSYVYFDQMNLQGGIPEDLGRLSNLEELSLGNNNLTGVIPSSLVNCTLLVRLWLQENLLTGEVPSGIGLLTNLERLSLYQNSFTGSFPTFIGNLTQLDLLEIGENLLNGTLDHDGDLGRLSQLQWFSVEDNDIGGPFPESLSNCSQLNYVDSSLNKLTGKIPPSLGNLTRLERLLLSGNIFQGMIPVDLTRCSKLGELDLSSNDLEGSLPPTFGQLSSLEGLLLSNNNFSGIIPSSLGNCSKMLNLSLHSNRFTDTGSGVFEDVISRMPLLIALDLSNNIFSGYWSSHLSLSLSLETIDISENNISGSISSLGNCKALTKVDLSTNNLTGGIPESVGLLSNLAYFNASYNKFQGRIPDFNVSKINLTKDSFWGNPDLCGSILGLNQECPTLSATHNGTSDKPCKSFSCRQEWIPTTCAGIGLVFIVVGAVFYMNTLHGAKKGGRARVLVNLTLHRRFSERDILKIIAGDHHGDDVIGAGASSVVYKGVSAEGEVFAVKVLSNYGDHEESRGDGSRSGSENDLFHEVHMLAKLRHRNVLKILSFYSSSDTRAMILEYMPRGSLHEHLHPPEGGVCELPWQTRFNIAIGVAEGMAYLHHDFPQPLIHRDLKPSNILLDANLVPKVADFGLSKFSNPKRDAPGVATLSRVVGTTGYMPPEYAMGTSVSTKGDVYSYGVVLLELLTGRRPSSTDDNFGPDGHVRGWVMELFEEKRPLELLDSTLLEESMRDPISKEQIMLLMRVGLFCTREAPQSRPSMSDVLGMLNQAVEMKVPPTPSRTIEDLANEVSKWHSIKRISPVIN